MQHQQQNPEPFSSLAKDLYMLETEKAVAATEVQEQKGKELSGKVLLLYTGTKPN